MAISATGPQVRAIVSVDAKPGAVLELHLECGHVMRRRVYICRPQHVLCRECAV